MKKENKKLKAIESILVPVIVLFVIMTAHSLIVGNAAQLRPVNLDGYVTNELKDQQIKLSSIIK